jgi:hypothetical protein
MLVTTARAAVLNLMALARTAAKCGGKNSPV